VAYWLSPGQMQAANPADDLHRVGEAGRADRDRARTHRTAPTATAPTKTKDPTLTKPVSANSWRYSLRARWAMAITRRTSLGFPIDIKTASDIIGP